MSCFFLGAPRMALPSCGGKMNAKTQWRESGGTCPQTELMDRSSWSALSKLVSMLSTLLCIRWICSACSKTCARSLPMLKHVGTPSWITTRERERHRDRNQIARRFIPPCSSSLTIVFAASCRVSSVCFWQQSSRQKRRIVDEEIATK